MSTEARGRSRALRDARAAAERRRRKRIRLIAAGGGLIVVGLVAAIVIALVNAAGGRPSPAAAPGRAPAIATAGGALALGRAGAPVTVEVYLDYMCPYCGRFEAANGGEIARLVAAGTVRLELHPLAFLDQASGGTRYSTRAANAVATVADRAPDKVLPFTAALYAHQPAEGSQGLSDARIAALARESGVPAAVVDAFAGRSFEAWAAAATQRAFASGITGTPTVKIGGTPFKGDLYTTGPFTDAVTAAAKGAR
ncbi:DsbA family protein [Actinomadura sp. ATCC 31491]|uniref:DsbA family protein n=1 Tax=Actinomadura luzonensis TaxID=2805427 RepID=A0ABT0G3L0_9ACTN|nr:thioredoxin domain-containing protein [Actinomadura luzonensis]MCK2219160.1 DsbA family protein [Actinomadura luzonensis]